MASTLPLDVFFALLQDDLSQPIYGSVTLSSTMKSNRLNQKAKVMAPRKKPNKSDMELPPNLNSTTVSSVRRRFNQIGALSGTPFTMSDGHLQFGVAFNATTGLSIVDMWRIKKINLYLSGDDKQVTLTPVSNDTSLNFVNSREVTYILSSMNDAQSRHLSIGPKDPFDPLFSWHHTTTTNFAANLFLLTSSSSSGLVMDITFEYVVNWVGSPLGYTFATTAGTGLLGGFACCNSHMSLVGINSLG